MKAITGLVLGTLSLVDVQTRIYAQKGGAPPPGPGSHVATSTSNPAGTGLSDLNRIGAASYVAYGTVTLGDGSPPHQLVMMERVCRGKVQQGGFADSKGRFTFDLGVLNRALGDGSTANLSTSQLSSNALSADDLKQCEVRASLAGYRSPHTQLEASNTDKLQLKTMVLEAIGKEQNPARSESDQQASKTARKLFDKGLDAASQAKWAEAADAFAKAVNAYPQYASAWMSLGMLQAGSDAQQAFQSYGQAIAADVKFSLPLIQAAELAAANSQWDQVVKYASQAISADPDSFPRAYLIAATAYVNLRNYPKAEQSAQKGIAIDKDHAYPELEYLVSLALLGKGDRPAAIPHLQAYLNLAPKGTDAAQASAQLAKLKSQNP